MNARRDGLPFLAILALGSCSGGAGQAPPPASPGAAPGPAHPAGPPPAPAVQPAGWADGLALAPATDINPDPRVVEVNIDAKLAPLSFSPGMTTQAWTYNGGVPGPLIRVKQGDRLIVHFTNHLPEETTIHWHGLRIPVAMDGVPHESQAPVRPGESFVYDFVVPDVGLFWYHPHVRSSIQVGAGLYGALLVEDPAGEPAGFGDPLVLMLSDVSIDGQGQFLPPDTGGDVATLFGREGNVILVNGRSKPILGGRVNVRQRWRVVNAAKSRYFQLALDGSTFIRIGGDGGLLPTPVPVERPLLAPGERADLVVVPGGTPGTDVPLRWIAYDRGFGTAFMRPDETVLTMRLSPDAALPPGPLPGTHRTIEPLPLAGATPVELRLTESSDRKNFSLGINGQPFGGPPLQGRVGETQIWSVVNTIDWDHPFHLHGFFFQVLDDAGQPRVPMEWKDTVNVPQHKTVKLAVRYDDRPGMWMFHCHILDHADAGMLGMLMLGP
jgi:FtsP/CotA-like multicopper oxidase with cupredoxin domain